MFKVFDELEQYDLTCPITDYSSAGLFEVYSNTVLRNLTYVSNVCILQANGIAIISNTRLSNKDQEAGKSTVYLIANSSVLHFQVYVYNRC